MDMIKRVNPGRGGFTPGIIRINVKTTLHPVTHRALCVAAVEKNRPFPLLLDDVIAEYFDIPIEERLPGRPEDGPGDGPEVGSAPRSNPGTPRCGPSAS